MTSDDSSSFYTIASASTTGCNVRGTTATGDKPVIACGSQFKGELARILSEFPRLFDGIGKVKGVYHSIDTGDSAPVVRPAYRTPVHYKARADVAIRKLEDDGMIVPSCSDYAAPVIVVKKKDSDEPRICIDYRGLNKVTRKDAFASPRIDDLLNRLGKKKIFSRLDVKSAYYHVEVHPDSRHKTAFRYEGRLMEWVRLPMGLSNSPSTWNRLIHSVVGNLPFAVCYFDDICVASESSQVHSEQLKQTLRALNDAGIRLNPDKCEFFVYETEFLGFKVTDGAIGPSSSKVGIMEAYVRPKTVDDVKRFVGMCGYYRRLIPEFAKRIEPLQKLSLMCSKKFAWDGGCESSFEDLRAMMSRAPVCQLFDPNLPTIVRTDASGFAFGGVLEQVGKSGIPHAVEFFSKRFDKTQRNYSTIEREAHAVINSLKHWRHYLVGKKFCIETDHKPLVWIRTKRDLSGKLGRWALFLEEFEYEIRFVKGSDNVVSDSLSRLEIGAIGVDKLRTETQKDDILQQLLSAEGYSEKDGLIFFLHPKRGSLLVPPRSVRSEILAELHDHPMCGHHGTRRTLIRCQERFHWPGMTIQVKRYCKSCHVCAVSKDTVVSPTAPMMSSDMSNIEVWGKVCMDFMGPLPTTERGNRFIIVLQDYVTKWVEVKAVPDTTSATVEEFLMNDVFCRFGIPAEMVSDNGTQLTSVSFRSFCQKLGIRQRFTSIAHPMSDPAERMMRTLQNMMRCYVKENQSDWDLILPNCVFAYRTSRHSTTGYSPAEALMGRQPRLPIDLRIPREADQMGGVEPLIDRMTEIRREIRSNVLKKQKVQKAEYDGRKKVKSVGFEVGTQVYWKKSVQKKGLSPKLMPKRHGPFKVVQKLENGLTYVVADENGTASTVHVNNLVPSHSTASPGVIRKRGRPRKS